MRHLGKAGAFAAEQIAHVGAALRLAAAESVHPLAFFAARLAAAFAGWRLAASRRPRSAAPAPGFLHRLTGDF